MSAPRRAVFRRLSESALWNVAHRFYERAGIDAWRTATVPHHVTSNLALATAYARVVFAFLRDTDGSGRRRREPLYVIELGAGSGRFAFLFLRALDALAPRADIRYVMTDVADATIDFWRRHEAFAPFLHRRRLDFARFDADRDHTVTLQREGRVLARGAPAARVVVVASYVFGALRQDAFALSAHAFRDYLVSVRRHRNERAADSALTWRVGARVGAPYAEDAYNGILADYRRGAATARMDTAQRGSPTRRMLFPIGALRCLDRLAALAHDALFLVADRASTTAAGAMTNAVDLEAARHGAVSFPVSVHAIRRHVVRRGGEALPVARGARELRVAGFLLGTRRGTCRATRRTFPQALAAARLDHLYRARRALTTDAANRDVAGTSPHALLSLMRRAGADPRVVAECIRPLWPHLIDAGARLRLRVRDTVVAAWPNYFHVGEPYDLPFNFGLVLYQVRAYADAHALFEQSLRLYGDDAATWWNLGLCHVALGRPVRAHTAFRRARRLAPDIAPAGLATTKLGRASHV